MSVDMSANWAKKIRAAWHRSVAAIFEVGDLLVAAKKKLPHGQFEKMVQTRLRWDERTAQRLMAVAHDKRLRAKATHGSLLPASWRTLYELSRLTDQQLEQAFANGDIGPEMHRRDAEAIGARSLQEIAAASSGATVVVPADTADTPSEPLRLEAGRDRRDEDLPQITEKEIHRAGVDGDAKRLIDELARSEPDVRERAVELVLDKQHAYHRELFERAVRELAAGLDRASVARRTANLRLIADTAEAEREGPDR
jgi:hypothetical protein